MNDDELVDAFADALRAEPPAADESELARAAIDEALVSRAADVLRAEPPPDAVTLLGESPRARHSLVYWAAAAVAVLAIGVGLWASLLVPGETPPRAAIEERRVGAHRIVSKGAEYTVDEHDGVVVTLARGEALFIVAPLEGRSFTVRAGDLSVRVTGTIFSVARDGAVRVYEGSVEVSVRGGTTTLRAGESIGAGFAPAIEARGRAEASARAEPVPEERPVRPPPPNDDAIRALLVAGDHRGALAASERALRSRPRSSELWMLRGDAMRGLGNRADAVNAYERAIALGSPSERAIAGLSAARVVADDDPARAIELLDRSGALAAESPVESSARALRDRLDAPP